MLSNGLDVTMDIARYIGDVDATYDLINNDEIDLDLIFGIRGAYLKNRVNISVAVDGSDWDRNQILSTSKFYGFGPRFGFSGNLEIDQDLAFEAGSTASLLVGPDRTHTFHTGETDTGDSKSTRFVSIVDMELALVYSSETPIVRVGLDAEWWANAPDHFRNYSSTSPTPPLGKDYLFFGPFVELLW